MSQEIILNKFIKYLSFKQEELSSRCELLKETKETDTQQQQQLKQARERIKELKKLIKDFDEGHCLGFSLCYSSMAYLGEDVLAWWEAVLCTIAKWDETKEALTKPIDTLPPLSHTESKTTNLETLMVKAIDYIKPQHGDTDLFKDNNGQDHDQESILKPQSGVFELLTKDRKIKKVEHAQTVAGHFTDAQLASLLEEKEIEGAICLLHDGDHTLSLSYSKVQKKWRLYDPTNPHETGQIHELFASKADLIKEIKEVLEGDSLSIEIASLEPSKVVDIDTRYRSIINDSVHSLTEGSGLCQIAEHCPQHLDKVLDQMVAVMGKAHGGGLDRIASALAGKTSDGWTGLQVVARYSAAASLERALDYAIRAPKGAEKIAAGLEGANEQDWTPLHSIARSAPTLLCKVLSYAAQGAGGAATIASALTKENEDGWTVLDMISIYAPSDLGIALHYAAKAPEAPVLIAASLIKQSTTSLGLQRIIKYAPSQLTNLFEFFCRADKGCELILKIANEKNNKGKTNWQLLKECMPFHELYRLQHHILNSAGNNKEIADSLHSLFFPEVVSAAGFFSARGVSDSKPDADIVINDMSVTP